MPEAQPTETSSSRFDFVTRHVVALVLFVLAVVFIVENTKRVRIRVLVPEVTAPLWAALAGTLLVGMLILLLLQRQRRRRQP